MKSHPLKDLLLLSLLALLVYSNTFSVPFIFDDTTNITENAKIQDLSGFIDFSGNRYLGFLTFALNYHFGGLNVFGYHLVNLLIHIANGFLVYSLVLLLFRASQNNITPPPPPLKLRGGGGSYQWIALATALLFIAHPVQTQAVTYIVQRFASLVTLFYLLAVVCYLKWRIDETRGWKLEAGSRKLEAGKSSLQPPASSFCGIWGSWIWYIASLLSTLLAMKTKENSFTLPFMILLVEMVFFRPFRKSPVTPLRQGFGGQAGHRSLVTRLRQGFGGQAGHWKAVIPFFLLAVPIIPLSHYDALGEAEGFARDTDEIGRLDYLFIQFRVIVTYLRLLVLPINQNLDYDYPVYHSLFDAPVFASFLFLIFVLGVGIYFLRNSPQPPLKLRGGEGELCRSVYFKLIAFSLLWFFLTLSIESSIIPIKDVIFEHRIYLPSAGLFLSIGLLASWGWERWKRIRTPLVILGAIVLAAFAVATYRRNLVWANAVTLWEDVVDKAPGKPRGHYNLGLAWQEKGMFEEAISSYRMTIGLKPDYADAHNNLGNIYKAEGRHDEAIKEYEQAFTVEPDHAESRNNLGIIYTMRGRLEEAIRLYQKALELKPDYADACNNLGIAYSDAGRLEEAVEMYRKGLSLKSNLDRTHFNLGNVYVQQGKFEEAVDEYQAAVDLEPETADYHYALGNAYAAWNRLKEAALAYEAALSVKPDFAEAHNNLGNVHMIERRFEEAVREYRKALEIKPDYADAARNLDYVEQQLNRKSPLP